MAVLITETQWKAKLRKAIDEIGTSLSLHGHMMQARGWPDLWIGTKNWAGWVELKAWDGELSAAQRIVGRRLEAIEQFAVLRLSRDCLTCTRELADGTPVPGEAPALDPRAVVRLLSS